MRKAGEEGGRPSANPSQRDCGSWGEFCRDFVKKLSPVAERSWVSFVWLEQRSPRILWTEQRIALDSNRLYAGLFPSQDGRGLVSVENLPWSTKGILESVRRERFW